MGPGPKVVVGAALTGVLAAVSHSMRGPETTNAGDPVMALVPYLAMFVAYVLGLLIARFVWRDTRRSGR